VDSGNLNFPKQLIYTARFPAVFLKLKAVINIEIFEENFEWKTLHVQEVSIMTFTLSTTGARELRSVVLDHTWKIF